jgi:hypothetical protein
LRALFVTNDYAMNACAISAVVLALSLSIMACSTSSPIAPTPDRPVGTLIPSAEAVAIQTAPGPAPFLPTQRTPDPAPGARLPLPDVQAFVAQASAERPGLLAQSCPTGRKYENNPWLDYIVDRLRTLDTRWGYNGKPSRTAADNDGFPVIAAGDEIAYHFGAGPDQGSPDVHLVDVLSNHCGPTPALTWRVFTGEEPGFWTGVGRLPQLRKAKPPI